MVNKNLKFEILLKPRFECTMTMEELIHITFGELTPNM